MPAGATLVGTSPASNPVPTATASSPSNFSYWNNLGQVPNQGSAVYLGDGWVLTAGHVQGGNNSGYTFVIPGLNNGQDATFTPITASQIPLVSDTAGYADLTLFKVQDDPLLHTLPKMQFGVTPSVGTNILITGSGYNRGAVKHWTLSGTQQNPTWTEVANGGAYHGYGVDVIGSTKRWGTNVSTAAPGGGALYSLYNSNNGSNTQIFFAQFDANVPNEGVVVGHDSGGGVFAGNRLIGLNLALFTYTNQPANTVVYGDLSGFANLYTYVDQLASVSKFHPSRDGDANLDGIVDINDFKILYDNFGTGTKWTQGDFNLDGKINFVDYQMLELNMGGTAPALGVDGTLTDGVTGSGSGVPEPATITLLGLGAGTLLMRRRGR